MKFFHPVTDTSTDKLNTEKLNGVEKDDKDCKQQPWWITPNQERKPVTCAASIRVRQHTRRKRKQIKTHTKTTSGKMDIASFKTITEIHKNDFQKFENNQYF